MKSVIIYDASGAVHNVLYGETEQPEGVLSVVADIPNGCTVKRVDTAKEPPEPVYNYWPAIDLDSIRADLMQLSKKTEERFKNCATNEDVNEIMEYTVDLDYNMSMLQLGI